MALMQTRTKILMSLPVALGIVWAVAHVVEPETPDQPGSVVTSPPNAPSTTADMSTTQLLQEPIVIKDENGISCRYASSKDGTQWVPTKEAHARGCKDNQPRIVAHVPGAPLMDPPASSSTTAAGR